MSAFLTRVAGPLAIALTVLSSCSVERTDPNQTKLQYVPDMADNPTVKAQESYLLPPENSVATSAVLYPATDALAEKEFNDPVKDDSPGAIKRRKEQGKVLYQTYCSVCHGDKGDGKPYLGKAYMGGVVPSLITKAVAARKDGFYFQKISKGGPIMPGYAHATHYLERWKIIRYVRELQEQSGAIATPAPSKGQ